MKIEEQVCTIEQMKELEKFGFDTEKASMAWLHFENDEDDDWMVAIHNDDCYELSAQTCVPTFSISDMLEMLPEKINYQLYRFHLCAERLKNAWSVCYIYVNLDNYEVQYNVNAQSLCDALVSELKLLKENKEI